jgi:hypothetical protein
MSRGLTAENSVALELWIIAQRHSTSLQHHINHGLAWVCGAVPRHLALRSWHTCVLIHCARELYGSGAGGHVCTTLWNCSHP